MVSKRFICSADHETWEIGEITTVTWWFHHSEKKERKPIAGIVPLIG